jgi:diguanylate cyclase (GGDEF)-like protein
VLVVDDQEWSARSLESVLMPNGFATLRAFTGAAAMEQARAREPDIVLVGRSLPDIDGLELCVAMREQQILGDRVPLLVTMHERPPRAERLAALRAGAWEVLAPPLDAEELILKLESYARAKFDSDRIRESGLLDARTGLYNANGLERRAAELGARAQRQRESLSCVILGVIQPETVEDAAMARATEAMVAVLRRIARHSDVVGRIGQAEFAVLAPGTDAAQAVRLAERLADGFREAGVLSINGSGSVKLLGGYDSVSDAQKTPLRGPELITHATAALARAKVERNGEWLKPFRPVSLPNEAPTSRH